MRPPRDTPLSTIAIACVLLVAPTLAACGDESAPEAGSAVEAETAVEGAVAAQDTVSLAVRSVGSLEADARVVLRPEIDGHVTSIHFTEGEGVEEGDLLVRLDQNKLEAQVEAAEATVESARAEVRNLERRLERNDTLLAQGAISQQAYDDLETQANTARARFQEARANLRLAEQQLEDATIRAPFSGRTGARNFDVGDYVRVGDDLFTLVDDDPMEIGFTVPERYLGSLVPGSSVELTVRSMPGRTFEGQLDFISPYVDPTNRSVQLKARVPNPEAELRAGQFADVRLQIQSRPAVLVPEAAVVPRQDGNVVFVVRDGRAVRTRVELGARRRGEVEIVSGVSRGDTVVVAGQQNVGDGAAVSVTMTGGMAGGGDAADAPSGPAGGAPAGEQGGAPAADAGGSGGTGDGGRGGTAAAGAGEEG